MEVWIVYKMSMGLGESIHSVYRWEFDAHDAVKALNDSMSPEEQMRTYFYKMGMPVIGAPE